jgi:hypothetical protein
VEGAGLTADFLISEFHGNRCLQSIEGAMPLIEKHT